MQQLFIQFYILVFTCLNIRSIHVELVENMSSAAFVQAFIRFTNIYDIPSHIYSDNARSFKQVFVTNISNKHVKSEDFKNKFLTSCIKHICIPVYSPWFGSTWDHLIRVI